MNLNVKKAPLILFFIVLYANAQCDRQETLTFCDMTVIDGNSDGTPDGVINLYEAYTAQIGGTLTQGTWFDPNYNFALDEATGDLFLWDLNNASEMETDHQFELTNSDCTTGPAITINVILGPFSGVVIPPSGVNSVNVQICDIGEDPCGSLASYDMDLAFLSVPSPHANGEWQYRGNSPNFLSLDPIEGLFSAQVPYTPGPPLVDEEIFEVFYVVEGIAPCTTQETAVKISVIREVFSGFANEYNICETEMDNGTYDDDIDLQGDDYLVNEDIEGIWLGMEDPTGQITGPEDSIINLLEVYDNLIATKPRFGCQTFEYKYSVNNRSAVCLPDTSAVKFTFHEKLRPFSQTPGAVDFCVNDADLPERINLYDLLTFTNEAGVVFDYPSDCCTSWSFISGPSDLGLVSDTCDAPPGDEVQGTINLENLTNADDGTYVFEFTVASEYNCECTSTSQVIYDPLDNGCTSVTNTDGLCAAETAQVSLTINSYNYAGEDTPIVEYCESNLVAPLDLITLLDTDGVNDPIYIGALGTWTDLDTGATITNPYTLPTINGQTTFNFNYTTTTAAGCEDSADLSLTIYQEYSSGDTTPEKQICGSADSFDLLEQLLGDPDNSGTWTLPDGTTTADSDYVFDPETSISGVYIYTVPPNRSTIDPTIIVCPGNSNEITVTVFPDSNAGDDNMSVACRSDGQFDLATLLDPLADTGGSYNDSDMTGALSGSIVNLTLLSEGVYTFTYEIQSSAACPLNTATFTLTVSDLAIPLVEDATFCTSETPTLADIQVNNATNFAWFDTVTATTPLDITTTLINGEDYYVAATDATNTCFSARAVMTVTIGENSNAGMDSDGTACKSDGQFDLTTLLDPVADAGGTFIDVDTTGALSGNILDLSQLVEGTYTFRYEIQASPFCPLQTATVEVSVVEIEAISVSDRTFCISDRATLADIEVNGTSNFEWFATATSTEPLDLTTVLMNGEDYYLAATDASSTCFAARDSMAITLLPFGDNSCDSCINDGVSPNGDSQNDNLDLCDLPLVFPNFEIKIFNRYGTIVYKGNVNTTPFEGKSNMPLSLGENLPSGTYFYIFDPKDNITDPLQSNFYLRR